MYDTEKVVKSGQNVEMPGRREFVEEVRELLRQGCISEKDLERMIRPNVATAVAFGLYAQSASKSTRLVKHNPVKSRSAISMVCSMP